MSDWYLRLTLSGQEEAQWLQMDRQAGVTLGPYEGSLQMAASQIADAPVTLVVPTEDVGLYALRLPARSAKQLVALLPYALEDDIPQPVEQVHYVLGPKQPTGEYWVSSVSRAEMDQWLNPLSAQGLKVKAIVPDVFGLPCEQDRWHLLCQEGRLLLRKSSGLGFACDESWAISAIKQELGALEPAEMPHAIHVWGTNASFEAELSQALESLPCESHILQSSQTFAWICGQIKQGSSISLRQGDYAYRESRQTLWRYWKPVVIVATGWCLVVFGQALLEYQHLKTLTSKLDEEILSLYQSTFPADKRIVNPKVQMETHLKSLRSTQGQENFFSLLAKIGQVIQVHKEIELISVRFSRVRGGLEFDIESPSYQVFEGFRQALEASLSVDVRSANLTTNNVVKGRLVVKEKVS